MLKEINLAHICLIPKDSNSIKVEDYRPISLCNTIYKIIAKCLAKRLKIYLPELVSTSQTAFILSRKIADNILLSQELLLIFNQKNSPPRLCIQFDLSKAFNSVNQDYVIAMLKKMSFKEKFTSWIKWCIENVSFDVLDNGEESRKFGIIRGLRQSDPLFPMLFVLAMEGLTTLMNYAEIQ